MYTIKEIYFTIQGEGFHTGRPAIFIRFTGCNLWSGLEKDRENAICNWCDTDFIGNDGELGGRYNEIQLANIATKLWKSNVNLRDSPCPTLLRPRWIPPVPLGPGRQ